MSHELDDNIERRKYILAKIRRHNNKVTSTDLMRIIMEMGYNLRGAREKVKELKFGRWLKVRPDGYLGVRDSDTHKEEEGEGDEGSGVEE